MRAKTKAVFIGKVENSFKDDQGNKVDYKQISINVPGELESCIVSVPKEVDFNVLVPYQPCFLIIDFRFNSQYRNYKARVVKICKDDAELTETDLYFDNPEANGYLASMSAANKSRA